MRIKKIDISELEDTVRKALSSKYSTSEIDLMLPVIFFGELSNTKSHGIIRVCSTGESILSRNPTGKPKVVIKSKVSKLVESNGNPGMLMGAIACSEVIKLAKQSGIGLIGTKGSTSSSGSLTYYIEKIAKQDLIAVVMARAPADVAPHGGTERLLGTNPIAFGIPSKDKPFLFDMATSAISYGAVARAKALNENLPENVAIDPEGNITRDPSKALEGAFLTFDKSYKGFGLSMIVEILAGVFTGANFLDFEVGDGWGNLFIAIDPKILSNPDIFKRNVRKLIERIRNSKSVNKEKIRIPGENKLRVRDEALKRGWVEVDEKTLTDIKEFSINKDTNYLK